MSAYFEHEEQVPVPFVKGFKVRSPADCAEALSIEASFVPPHPILEEDEKWYAFSDAFGGIPSPTCIDDWLAQYKEEGQSVGDYLRSIALRSGAWKPFASANCHTIYLQPLGTHMAGPKAPVDAKVLAQFTEAFYLGCKVVLLPAIELHEEADQRGEKALFWHAPDDEYRYELKARFDSKTGRRQLHVDPILHLLADMRNSKAFKEKYPNAFCIMALTMEDLYSCPTDLFVAGMAAGGSKVAVFSFARYQPRFQFSREFWFTWRAVRTKADPKVILRRSIKLLVHELAHLFGIGHCVYFDCCMNGSGHLEEDFRQAMFLCPVDLKKLKVRLGPACDLGKRYQLLCELYRANGLLPEAEWITHRIEQVLGKGPTTTKGESKAEGEEPAQGSSEREPTKKGEEESGELRKKAGRKTKKEGNASEQKANRKRTRR